MLKLKSSSIQKVREGGDWDLKFDGKIYKTVKARYLYDLLAKNAYTHNEPGIFNIDHANEMNTGYWDFDIVAPNPCVAGETRVEFRFGDGVAHSTTVKDLVEIYAGLKPGHYIYVKSYDEKTQQVVWKMLQGAGMTKRDAELLRITDTVTGKAIHCTPDHKILTKRGWIEAQHLNVDDQIVQA